MTKLALLLLDEVLFCFFNHVHLSRAFHRDGCLWVQVPLAPSVVDLHGQINRPITKSPLLMSCYANHMTQLSCSNWSVRAPQPVTRCTAASRKSAVTILTAVGIPHFSYVSEGFTPGLMVERLVPKSPPLLRGPSKTVHGPNQKRFFADDAQSNNSQTDAGELILMSDSIILFIFYLIEIFFYFCFFT